jgi:CRP/FNR family transcriptional regulator, cyclic AMP receptor protein
MEKVDVLKTSPLFEMLSQPELEVLAELSKLRRYAPGDIVFEEGDLGDSLYVIVSGQLEVVKRMEPSGERLLATLNDRDFFGEMSLVDKEYRSATVRAKGDAQLLQLSAENLVTFRRTYKDGFAFLLINIARVLSGRLRETNQLLAQAPK